MLPSVAIERPSRVGCSQASSQALEGSSAPAGIRQLSGRHRGAFHALLSELGGTQLQSLCGSRVQRDDARLRTLENGPSLVTRLLEDFGAGALTLSHRSLCVALGLQHPIHGLRDRQIDRRVDILRRRTIGFYDDDFMTTS